MSLRRGLGMGSSVVVHTISLKQVDWVIVAASLCKMLRSEHRCRRRHCCWPWAQCFNVV